MTETFDILEIVVMVLVMPGKAHPNCKIQVSLTGFCMYFLRTSTKRTLGEETFQREIMAGLVNASLNENLLWNIERTVSNVFIPLLNTNCMGDKGSSQLLIKVIFLEYE